MRDGGRGVRHAIRRALERYGVRLTVDQLRNLAADCAAGRSVLLGKADYGAERHLVRLGDTALIAVYFPHRAPHHPPSGSIATFLAPDDPGSDIEGIRLDPTHWMPLPEPPKARA